MIPKRLTSMRWAAMPLAVLLAQVAVAQVKPADPGQVDPRASLPRGTPDTRQTHILTVEQMPTSWTASIRLPLFDPANGVLKQVVMSLTTELVGSAGVESLDTEPSQANLHFSATVSLRKPRGDVVVELHPRQDFVDQLGPFDGSVDFGGPSGVNHLDIVIHDAGTPLIAQATDLLFFTGAAGAAGSIDMLITAEGTSSADGPGNMVTSFQQAASAEARITYVFEPVDCNGNGVPDADDLSSASSQDTNANAVPDECESVLPYCFGDGPQNGGPECPCGNSTPGNTAGCLNSTGRGARLDGTGTAQVGNDSLQLVGTGFPANSTTMWMQAKTDTAGTIFGSGLLCIGGTTNRLAVMTAPPTGSIGFPRDGDLPLSKKFGIQPGEKKVYQVWYRDVPAVCGVNPNTTNGVIVVWR